MSLYLNIMYILVEIPYSLDLNQENVDNEQVNLTIESLLVVKNRIQVNFALVFDVYHYNKRLYTIRMKIQWKF